MPNLNQNYALKKQLNLFRENDSNVYNYLEKVNEATIRTRKYNSGRVIDGVETKTFSFLNESINIEKPDLIKYFEEGKEEDVALLFIDITSFSKTIQGWSNCEITSFLDDYYRDVIPIIYKYGGEIEKLMGDGIICIFGKPFLELESPRYVYRAERCAKEVIKHFFDSDKNVKVAIHKGVVNYYKVPSEFYGEYTMIGQPITDLYRLESVSISNAINFFSRSSYDLLGWDKSIFNEIDIVGDELNVGSLQGVDYTKIKYMKLLELE